MTNDKKVYKESGFTLEQTSNVDKFINYHVIYSELNFWLFNNFKNRKKDLITTKENCYWLKKNGEKIGGAYIEPNTLALTFLIPPFCDKYIFYGILHKRLFDWSDETEKIQIYNIIAEDKKFLKQLGYKVAKERCLMIRPTDRFLVNWEGSVTVNVPEEGCIHEIAEFLLNVHSQGTNDMELNKSALNKKTEELGYFLKEFIKTESLVCSSIIRDSNTNNIVGVCIAGKLKEDINNFCGIVDIGVRENFRRQGLAKNMIKLALHNAEEISPAIYLGVTVGNPAQNLYYKMGFRQGMTICTMSY